MAKRDVVNLFSFESGTPSWGYGQGLAEDRGLFDPRFSSLKSVPHRTYPDPGLPAGAIPSLIFGERLPPELYGALTNPIPTGGSTPKTLDKVPDDLARLTDGEFGQNTVVSERLKAVIETLEPGVHQFIPVGFVTAVSRRSIWTETDWFYFNNLTWIEPDVLFDWQAMGDAVSVLHQPEDEWGAEWNILRFRSLGKPAFVIRREAMETRLAGRHVWCTSRYIRPDLTSVHIEPKSFCSPTFRKACKDAGLRGGHFLPLPIS